MQKAGIYFSGMALIGRKLMVVTTLVVAIHRTTKVVTTIVIAFASMSHALMTPVLMPED